jgi:spermidine/putrescine transport system ATP-binding protein
MNIYDNIAFGLKMKKKTRSEIQEQVLQCFQMVQLEGFEKRYPSQLSGGQKHARAMVARAIVNNPRFLLLDEPLGALDMKLRKQMRSNLSASRRNWG